MRELKLQLAVALARGAPSHTTPLHPYATSSHAELASITCNSCTAMSGGPVRRPVVSGAGAGAREGAASLVAAREEPAAPPVTPMDVDSVFSHAAAERGATAGDACAARGALFDPLSSRESRRADEQGGTVVMRAGGTFRTLSYPILGAPAELCGQTTHSRTAAQPKLGRPVQVRCQSYQNSANNALGEKGRAQHKRPSATAGSIAGATRGPDILDDRYLSKQAVECGAKMTANVYHIADNNEPRMEIAYRVVIDAAGMPDVTGAVEALLQQALTSLHAWPTDLVKRYMGMAAAGMMALHQLALAARRTATSPVDKFIATIFLQHTAAFIRNMYSGRQADRGGGLYRPLLALAIGRPTIFIRTLPPRMLHVLEKCPPLNREDLLLSLPPGSGAWQQDGRQAEWNLTRGTWSRIGSCVLMCAHCCCIVSDPRCAAAASARLIPRFHSLLHS